MIKQEMIEEEMEKLRLEAESELLNEGILECEQKK